MGRGTVRAGFHFGGAVGFVFGASSGWTGSARRTSGSAELGGGVGDGTATIGCTIGVIAATGVGLGVSSAGEDGGAMTASGEAVAAGVTPTSG